MVKNVQDNDLTCFSDAIPNLNRIVEFKSNLYKIILQDYYFDEWCYSRSIFGN